MGGVQTMNKVISVLALLLQSLALADPFIYVANMGVNNISIIDTELNQITGTIGMGDAHPAYDLIITGNMVVTTGLFRPAVSFIDRATGEVESISTASAPARIVLSPDAERAYVAHRRFPDGLVSVIELRNKTLIATVHVGQAPDSLLINPTGSLLYVANLLSNTVSVIDTAVFDVVAEIEVNRPSALAMGFDETLLYVSNSQGIAIISTIDHTIVDSINLIWPDPISMAASTDGWLYVVHSPAIQYGDGHLSVINAQTYETVFSMKIRRPDFHAALTRDGRYFYMSRIELNNVVAFDTVKYVLLDEISGFRGPSGLAIP